MKNKLLTIALTAACCLTYIACDDNKDEFLDEFSTILSFRNCDEIEVEVYNTGENGEYQLICQQNQALNWVQSPELPLMLWIKRCWKSTMNKTEKTINYTQKIVTYLMEINR